MAKALKTKTSKQSSNGFLAQFKLENILPEKYHVLAVLLVLVILFLAFLSPMYFGGKTFQSGDILASKAAQPYIEKERDGFTLWNPHIFCGMPAYSLGTGYTWFNLIYVVFTAARSLFTSFFEVEYAMWSFYLIILAFTSFFLMKYLTKNTLVSLFTAIATSFSTGLIVFLFIGHVTKLTSICMYPLLFLLLFRLQEKFKLIDFLLLIITMQLLIQGFHVQIIFYTMFAVGIYYLYFFSRAIAIKDLLLRNNLIKSAVTFAGASIIALLIQSDNLTQIYEYTQYSTRGGKSVVEESTGKAEQSSSEYYEYHTNWSFSPGEVLTFIIPSYYGFGNSVYNGPLTQGKEVEVNTYFGQMPFVDVAMYMGVLVFFLALFAIVTCWKNPVVRFLTILSSIALLISFGKTFPVLFDLLFYNLPYFDKFRVPSMILVLVQLSLPLLAGYGIMKIISLKGERNNKAISLIKYLAFAFTTLFVLTLLFNNAFSDSFTSKVQNSNRFKNLEQSFYSSIYLFGNEQISKSELDSALLKHISGMLISDMLIAFSITALTFWLAYGYIKNKLSRDVLVLSIIVLALIDLWRIDSRGAKYSDNPDVDGLFNTPDYVNAIRGQKDSEPFRILNMKQDGSLGSFNQNSNFNAYFLLEDFYGYSGIKPRAYQDIIDVVGPVNPTLWNLANVKYIITDKPIMMAGLTQVASSEKSSVYKNEAVLPRVYFVNRVEMKKGIDILNSIKNNEFNPAEIAYTEEAVQVDQPDSTASVRITKYADEKIVVNVNASGNNFVVFTNTYVPTGWKATIDGNDLKVFRANHNFMGVVVPKGEHILEFTYAPTSFFISRWIAFILSSLVVAGLIIVLLMQKLSSRKQKISN
ncbi:MAG: YfhO family protein [Ignavibacteria bacterium]|nr:YfhO family protein [Ignavibacteria bacterium]